MISAEELVGEEWAEWYRLTPSQRWTEASRVWQTYLAPGGSLDHSLFIRQKGHAMLFAAAHRTRRKERFHSSGFHPQSRFRSKPPLGTDFIVV